MGTVHVVVDGQFGSCGKGAIAGWLTDPDRFDDGLAIRVAGPNAGHTVVDGQGRPWPLRSVPVAAVSNPHARLAIAAGSEIDPEVLCEEVDRLDGAGFNVSGRLVIDPAATILDDEHLEAESAAELKHRIGSTGKGIGAARAARIMRTARTARQHESLAHDFELCDVARLARQVGTDGQVLVEGTQGYGLGLHTRFYPYVTSQDCRAVDFLAQAGISPWARNVVPLVWLLFRPHPIRVAGNSGPLLDETTWEQLGLDPEYTTVTRKMRRVGGWDPDLALEAVQANGGPGPHLRVVLTMADHLDSTVRGVTDPDELLKSEPVSRMLDTVKRDCGVWPHLVGTGPDTIARMVPGV